MHSHAMIFEQTRSVRVNLEKKRSCLPQPCLKLGFRVIGANCTALQARRGADPSPKIVDHRRGHAKGHNIKWDKVTQSQSSPGL